MFEFLRCPLHGLYYVNNVTCSPLFFWPLQLSPSGRMTMLLENFCYESLGHYTLTDYRHHFHLRSSVNIMSSPTQHLQSFVKSEGPAYWFIIVSQLMSYKVAEDSVHAKLSFFQLKNHIITWLGFEFGHFLSVNLSQLQPLLVLTVIFWGQLVMLQGREYEWQCPCPGLFGPPFIYFFKFFPCWTIKQHAQWQTSKGHLVLRAYNASNHPLSSADIGSVLLAIVELRCLDVGHSVSTFTRVIFYFLFIFWSCLVVDILDWSPCFMFIVRSRFFQ